MDSALRFHKSPGVRSAVPGLPVGWANGLIGDVLSEAESAQLLGSHPWRQPSATLSAALSGMDASSLLVENPKECARAETGAGSLPTFFRESRKGGMERNSKPRHSGLGFVVQNHFHT